MTSITVSAAGVSVAEMGVPGGNDGIGAPVIAVAVVVFFIFSMVVTMIRFETKAAKLPDLRAGPDILAASRYEEVKRRARSSFMTHRLTYVVAAFFVMADAVLPMVAESTFAREQFSPKLIALALCAFLVRIAHRAQLREAMLRRAMRKSEDLLAGSGNAHDLHDRQRKAARLLGQALAAADGSDDVTMLPHT